MGCYILAGCVLLNTRRVRSPARNWYGRRDVLNVRGDLAIRPATDRHCELVNRKGCTYLGRGFGWGKHAHTVAGDWSCSDGCRGERGARTNVHIVGDTSILGRVIVDGCIAQLMIPCGETLIGCLYEKGLHMSRE